MSKDRLKRVFREADRNHDQYLTKDECLAALKQLGHVMDDKGIRRVMDMMDKNHDGRVSFKGKRGLHQFIFHCQISSSFSQLVLRL